MMPSCSRAVLRSGARHGARGLAAEDVFRGPALALGLLIAAASCWSSALGVWRRRLRARIVPPSWKNGVGIAWFYLILALVWGSP